MAEQRQPFRFWFPSWTNPPPTTQPRPPTQPTIPTPRPIFLPSGSAALQPPPQPQPQPRTQSQPTSPSRTTSQSQPVIQSASQPPSPSRTTTRFQPPRTASQPSSPSQLQPTTRTVSQPPSPSRTASQSQPTTRTASQPPSPSQLQPTTRTASQPPSPSRNASQSTQTASQPPSPSRNASQSTRTASLPPSPSRSASQLAQTASQPATASRTASQPPSPLSTASQSEQANQIAPQPQSPPPTASLSQPASQRDSQLPSPSRPSAPQLKPASPKETQPQPISSQPVFQEPQPKAETLPEAQTRSEMRGNTPTEPISQPAKVETEPIQLSGSEPLVASTSAQEAPAMSNSSEAATVSIDPIEPQKSEVKPQITKDEKSETKLEENQEGKPNIRGYEEPKENADPKLLAMESNPKARTEGQLKMTTGSTTEMPVVRTKMMEKQAITSENKSAPTGSLGKESKPTIFTSRKERYTDSETQPRASMSQEEKAPTLQKDIREGISKFVHKVGTWHPKQPLDEQAISVITLTGENKGASMIAGSEALNREGSVHIHRGYKLDEDGKSKETSDKEGSSNRRSNHPKSQSPAIMAYTNSNIQSINNSILFNSSCSERNSGVHLAFSKSPTDLSSSKEKKESFQAHKEEFSIAPSDKVTYKSTVRRRCLRGLFMESSESDPDIPQKPRRHGCRYSCAETEKNRDDNSGNTTATNGNGRKHAKEGGSNK
ncbi:uncharacterized protein LOC143892634 [Tasmannia lanceolata]|uniref:uncharacterized protein LOC143892634 n=1 Tax=Tasmannia lanceolata TaxID=3420 RepID=UPI004063A1DE